ncbi:MAG: hypothetical protein ACUZ8E_06355 [Candidatus Anammoxibacter sp.]
MSSTQLSLTEKSLQSIMWSWLETVSLDKRPHAIANILSQENFDTMLRSNEYRPDDYGDIWRQWLALKKELSKEELTSLWLAR